MVSLSRIWGRERRR